MPWEAVQASEGGCIHAAQVLPPGASKGAGVALLLRELGVRPEHLMALGDGENDVEMLQVLLMHARWAACESTVVL
jgi:HAD superfamily hydrolase (TIGR01484 family)